MDRSYFTGSFQLLPGGEANKYNCSRLAFKSKNKMCGVGLIKNYSFSNSNYFMSAKKMPTRKLYYQFHIGKNGIHIWQFSKNCNFPNIQLKGVVNKLPPFKNLSEN